MTGSGSLILSTSKSNVDGGTDPSAPANEEEANRTISMLAGTADLLKFSRLLLLLSEAISVSTAVGGAGVLAAPTPAARAPGAAKPAKSVTAAKPVSAAKLTPAEKSVPADITTPVMKSTPVEKSVPVEMLTPADKWTPTTATVSTVSKSVPVTVPETGPETDAGDAASVENSPLKKEEDPETARGQCDSAGSGRKKNPELVLGAVTGMVIGSGLLTPARSTRAKSLGTPHSVGKPRSSSPPLRPNLRAIDICPE